MPDSRPAPDITIWDLGRPNVQGAIRPFRTEWQQHDAIALAALAPEQRKAQLDARDLLLDFALDYYRSLDADELDELPPEWESVAGMVDLLSDLLSTATDAAKDDGEA